MADAGSNDRTAGLTRALVIDDDEWVRNQLAAYLRGLGVAEVDLAADGDGGWEALNKEKYGLIVLDWKLPGLSGLALFNRIRKHRAYRTVPLLVVSGLLEKFDFRLLQEFPCTALMEKPFTKQLFITRVEELLRESDWYGQNVAVVDSLLAALDGDAQKLTRMLRELLDQAPNPVPLALIVARRLLKAHHSKQAETVLRGVLKLDAGCVIAMNELGKTLHIHGQHKEALSVLREASKLSPSNLQRLCLMGEVELNLADGEAARASFGKALELDGDDATARAGTVVARNMEEVVGQRGAPQAVGQGFASLLNTIGITYVRNGQYTRGIEQYHAAASFLRSKTDMARVSFNMGLGYLRWGKQDAALPCFQRSEKLGGATFGKASRYVQRLSESELSSSSDAEMTIMPRRNGETIEADVPTTITVATDGAKVIPFKAPDADDDLSEESVGGGGGGSAKQQAMAKAMAAAAGVQAAPAPVKPKDAKKEKKSGKAGKDDSDEGPKELIAL